MSERAPQYRTDERIELTDAGRAALADGAEGDQVYLCIDRCHRHGYWAVSVRRGSHGQRVTPTKCCGSWQTVQEWPLTASDLRDVADWLDSPDWPVSLDNGARRPVAGEVRS